MVQQHSETHGDRNADHSYNMEVRRRTDGRWVIIMVHADSRLKAVKIAQEAGFDAAGGDVQQVR
ncbi:hypothetical protein D3C87_588020 [compost metagenome]